MAKLEFKGVHAEIIRDRTLERDVEGALSSGKTICCMWAELEAYKREPGIWGLMARWTGDAVTTLLRPQFEQVARLHGTEFAWADKQNYYEFENGSRAYCFGLKTQSQDPEERYGKIRGLPVSRIYISQAEQLPADIAGELRSRMRPDIEAQARGDRYRRQLTFDANPVDDDTGPSGHWLAKQFPANNSIKGRKYFSLSLYDNKHNLPPEFVDQQVLMYPEEHPKHRTMILGQRGFAVRGEPIFDDIFSRKDHVRELKLIDDHATLIEAFQIGKHNPCWVVGTRTPNGALWLLGGILGEGLPMEDFLPIVRQHRAEWFPRATEKQFLTCAPPPGGADTPTHDRITLHRALRDAKFKMRSVEHGSAPDVRLAAIEYLMGMLRRRTVTREESLGIIDDPARWLTASREGLKPQPFISHAFEGGYTWNKNFVSVSHQQLRQPTEDDKYANAMHCVENLALNFCMGRLTTEEKEQKQALLRSQQPPSVRNSGSTSWML